MQDTSTRARPPSLRPRLRRMRMRRMRVPAHHPVAAMTSLSLLSERPRATYVLPAHARSALAAVTAAPLAVAGRRHSSCAAGRRAHGLMRVLLARCAARAVQPTSPGHLLRAGALRGQHVARASVPSPPFPTVPRLPTAALLP
eukprot:561514-Pleurochrysis_carterae.AAC.3